MYLQQARPRIAAELGYTPAELARLHRRFEVVPGAQAQVDWGDEGGILAHAGIAKVYSFHMVLSYSRDPFCCYTTRQDIATFFACHRRAFEHFGGVPGVIVYDRTKTVVRRHVAPGEAVPLHPEAVAFAGHYGFDIDVLAAYRPTGKGRVERQVLIVRDHVLAGHSFSSADALDRAFAAWVPVRRATVHRTHGEVIGVRAQRDHAALAPVPARPYLVANRHLRHVGKNCMVAFEANLYSVPARLVFPRQLVEVRASAGTVSLHATVPDGNGVTLLAVHQRAVGRGARIVDPAHWAGSPTGTPAPSPAATRTSSPATPPCGPAAAGPPSRPGPCGSCWPAPMPPRSPSGTGRCRSMTRSPGPGPSPPALTRRMMRERARHRPDPRHRGQARPAAPGRDPRRPRGTRRHGQDGLPRLPGPDPGGRARRL
jgi:hypothetical protein